MNPKHTTPPEPPPHKLADWLHQHFLRRAAPPDHEGPSPWHDSNLRNSMLHTVLPPHDLTFTHQEVRSGRVGAAVDRLMDLTDTPQACAQNMSRFRLAFSGYSTSPHELAQIPDVASFFQKVTEQWPYWLHFLSPQPENMATLLNLTFTPINVDVKGDLVRSRIEISESSIANFQTMGRATTHLHNAMGAPKQITQTMGAQLRHALCLVLA
jgi:hypothetical protein